MSPEVYERLIEGLEDTGKNTYAAVRLSNPIGIRKRPAVQRHPKSDLASSRTSRFVVLNSPVTADISASAAIQVSPVNR